MNIIRAGYEIMPEQSSFLKKIELVARTCYKSEDLITEDSCVKMVDNLIQREHYAMLEHATLVLNMDGESFYDTLDLMNHIEKSLKLRNDYKTFKGYLNFTDYNAYYIISGNIRGWIEFLQECVEATGKIPLFFKKFLEQNKTQDNLVLFKEFYNSNGGYFGKDPEDPWCCQIKDTSKLSIEERLIHEILTVKFTVDRGVTHELVRHRDCSFAQESTRYCNYSKGKFGNELTVIEPCFFVKDTNVYTRKYGIWKAGCESCEQAYFELLEAGATPQEARDVLPTSVKADIIMTTNIREWIHILELRALGVTGKPHPQMEEVMVPLAKELATGKLSKFTCIESVNNMLSL